MKTVMWLVLGLFCIMGRTDAVTEDAIYLAGVVWLAVGCHINHDKR